MPLDISRVRHYLNSFEFEKLFNELGWSMPANPRPLADQASGITFERREIANLSGVVVLEITTDDGALADAKTREIIQRRITDQYRENLLIFLDQRSERGQPTASAWYWVKIDGGKRYRRTQTYFYGQPGDLLISQLSSIFFDIKEFDTEGNVKLVEVARRLQEAFDVEPVTKAFYAAFKDQHQKLVDAITGIDDERERRWYASVLLNRLMFVYFLQRKGFLNRGDLWYLQNQLAQSKVRGHDRFYGEFLTTLFFEGFAKDEGQRNELAQQLLGSGTIRYLNGGLFLPHHIEQTHHQIAMPDRVFDELFDLFKSYQWNLDDTPGGNDREINPAVLGYIFEKYINQKAFGAYYTRSEITNYLCEQTIHKLILDKINPTVIPVGAPVRRYESLDDLLARLDAGLCNELLFQILPNLALLDPACGSGAFLVAAMRTLIDIYSAIVGRLEFLNNPKLNNWLQETRAAHPNLNYFIKKRIITDNLFGVDIMPEATEIARLRLFLALVASADTVEQIEPLPNIDFNILSGNSLIGLLEVQPGRLPMLAALDDKQRSFDELLVEKNRLIHTYRNSELGKGTLVDLRDEIDRQRATAQHGLNSLLLEDFRDLKIKYEQVTWDAANQREGKPVKRPLASEDITALQPFHWGYEFDEILKGRGGFDAIITNPPWEIFKPYAKEFFTDYSTLVMKKKMNIKDFEQAQILLLDDVEIRNAWIDYASRFPYQSQYFRSATQYINQISIVNGKKAGSDTNLYKLFVEQCYNLLRNGGRCGIITSGGIYTDLGTKQLRELLFSQTQLDTLFGMSNEKFIFEGVHHAQKLCIFVFEKGAQTRTFGAAFRINPREAVSPQRLDSFLNTPADHLQIPVSLVRRLSPDSLSVMEFRSTTDVAITEKMLRFPLLGERLANKWNLILTAEFHMTSDHDLFETEVALGRLPLYEGKMIWQYSHQLSTPQYWIDEHKGRADLLKREQDNGQILDYQVYRLGIRAVASSTNERSLICTMLPRRTFCGNSVLSSKGGFSNTSDMLFCVSIFNSLVVDWMLRNRVTTNINMFYIYQLPIPRLTEHDPQFAPIVERAAKLICTTPEFDDLAREVGLGSHANGVTDPTERVKLRAELDGLVAHLYGLDEAEFTHILSTFPLVAPAVKDATLQAYRAFAPNPDDEQVARLIAGGEVDRVEFKVGAAWNSHRKARDDTMRDNILQAVAAFMNSDEGGALLIGVADNGTVLGLADDYQTANSRKPNRDGYALFLSDLLGSRLGRENDSFYQISFHQVAGVEICRINVDPATKPVYIDQKDFYVRGGNKKNKLSAREAIEYVKQRWGH